MLGDIVVDPEFVGVGEATAEGMELELCTDVCDGCRITGMVRAREESENKPTKIAVGRTA